jgi:NAD(P)-dependent dehydrogenase (short-subunit alcohol dehydrogenase family)
VRALAEQANASGRFDAIIHNAGVYLEPRRTETEDGLVHVFAVNTLAPYILTALIERPARLVYLTSGAQRNGDADLSDLQWERRHWSAAQAYADTKLHDVLLALAVARRWPGTISNAVDPGWVPTRMGGAGATGDLELGADTQAWLAVSDDAGARQTGRVLYHREPEAEHPAARDADVQDGLLRACERLTGVSFP